MSHLAPIAADVHSTMQVSIGSGSLCSAIIGAGIVLSRPAKLMAPITRPRYSLWKKVTVVKYRNAKATEILNFATRTRTGTKSITSERTEIMRKMQEMEQVA